MKDIFNQFAFSLTHWKVIVDFFSDTRNYVGQADEGDFRIFEENSKLLLKAFDIIKVNEQLYNVNNRQMILADLLEYIILGRCFYAMGKETRNKSLFIKGVMHIANLLMCFETITVNIERRNRFLDSLNVHILGIKNEKYFKELRKYRKEIGTPDSLKIKKDKIKHLNKYFDKLMPKTGGGLWHELLVYIFILRSDLGFIMPLLLHQRIYSKTEHIVPPDFLLLTRDKRIYGIEVGRKKEIQSGAFSIKTYIPTASVDTENSRNSDRCPICKKWICFCPFVIDNFANFEFQIDKIEVKCITDCDKIDRNEIINGRCKYSKYSRHCADTLLHTNHKYATGYHYHYHCVLSNVNDDIRRRIIEAEDIVAIKTHFPHYAGLEGLS